MKEETKEEVSKEELLLEVKQLKKDPNKRVYKSFSEVLEELDNDE